MKKTFFFTLLILLTLLAGCKNLGYDRQKPVTADEKSILSCDGVNEEILKVRAAIKRIDEDSDFDGWSYLSIVADFGITYAIDSIDAYAATKTAEVRLKALQDLHRVKGCPMRTIAVSLPAIADVPPSSLPSTDEK